MSKQEDAAQRILAQVHNDGASPRVVHGGGGVVAVFLHGVQVSFFEDSVSMDYWPGPRERVSVPLDYTWSPFVCAESIDAAIAVSEGFGPPGNSKNPRIYFFLNRNSMNRPSSASMPCGPIRHSPLPCRGTASRVPSWWITSKVWQDRMAYSLYAAAFM